jgi:hypothetical protein
MKEFSYRIEDRFRRERDADLEVRHQAHHGSSAAPGVPLSLKYGRQSTEGYTHDSRLIGRGVRN